MLKFIKDFSFPNRKHAVFCFLLMFLFLILLFIESPSQSQEEFPLITQVSIRIDGDSDGQDMDQLIPVKKGDLFSLKNIDNSIKKIYQTGLFSDVQVLREGEKEIKLVYILTRKNFTRRIHYRGKGEMPWKKLKEGIYSLSEGSPYSNAKLKRAKQELRQALREEGYFHPEIEALTEEDSQTSFVDVIFEVQTGKRYIINKIDFSGELLIPEDDLKREMETRERGEYVPSILKEDIRRLREVYAARDYHRARIEVSKESFDQTKGFVSLSIKVIPYEKIEILVRGAKVPMSLLYPIWEERIFEEWGLSEGEAKIISYLRKKGYIFSYVKSSIEKVNNTIRVIYNVYPKERYKIKGISFEGLSYFTPFELKKHLEIRKKVPFLSWIDGERLFDLPREIEILFKTEGFSNTKVSLNFLKRGKGIEAIFHIEEGTQLKIRNISFKGPLLFDRETLLKQITSFEEGPFFQSNIQKDIGKIESFYLNQGVRGTDITARVEKVDEDYFNVDFVIEEGKKVKIEKIVITGNVVTKRKTILRELRVKEGDYVFYDRIQESKRRLEKLGVFTKVGIEEIALTPEKENLIVSIREGKRNYASLGIGLETKNEPQTFAVWDTVIRPRGTAEFIRSNISGSGAQFSLIGQISLKEKRSVFSWEQPYFFGFPLRTYLNSWAESEERKSFSYNRWGISLTALKSSLENMLFLTTLRWAETTLFNLQIEESEVDRQQAPFSATSISWSFIWDRRSDPFNPEKGSFYSFVIEWAFPLLKPESDYFKSFVKYQQFIPVFSSITFSLTSRLGLGGGRMPIPIHERFFAGGSNSFRGSRFDELGPKDMGSQKPVGGEAMLLLNFELTFPLLSAFKNLSGALFYDKGNVFNQARYFNLGSLQDAAGFGIRYRTPLGPLRFELGWNLDVPQKERKILAFITIGNVF